MTTKYGFSDVRNQLIEDIRGAYPTKWEVYQAAEVVGEDAFGSPKPHPNAVLNLFLEQNIRFALPFAAYRASIGGFPAIMSDQPGIALPRHVLATTTNGMYLVRTTIHKAARAIAYEWNLGVCPDRECLLSVGVDPIGQRMVTLKRLYQAMIERDGDGLRSPSLGHLTCDECAKVIQASHVAWRSICWERLPSMFSVAQSWDEI